MSNMFDIEPCDFPDCPSCESNYDVDIDEIDEQFVCRRCMIQWRDNQLG